MNLINRIAEYLKETRIEGQNKRILAYLRKGNELDKDTAFALFGCTYPPARIHNIKRMIASNEVIETIEHGKKFSKLDPFYCTYKLIKTK